MVRVNREDLSFFEALQIEEKRIQADWSDMWRYAESTLYSKRVKKYISIFGSHKVKIILSEDFFSETKTLLADLCIFLGINPNLDLDTSQVHNISAYPKSKWLARQVIYQTFLKNFIRKFLPESQRRKLRATLMNINRGEKGIIDEHSYQFLRQYFYEDIIELEQLIGKKTNWINERIPDSHFF